MSLDASEKACTRIMRAIAGLRGRRGPALQRAWDRYWEVTAGEGGSHAYDPLAVGMIPSLWRRKVRKVLCVGNGVSSEPLILVQAGMDVVVLDISPLGNSLLPAEVRRNDEVRIRLGARYGRKRGRLNVHCGDFRDAWLCPGPYDTVICRSTLQYYPGRGYGPSLPVLRTLVNRLTPAGLIVIENHHAWNKSRHLWIRGYARVASELGLAFLYGIIPRPSRLGGRIHDACPPSPVGTFIKRRLMWFNTSSG